MHTQTHVIMSAALFGRGIPKRAGVAAAGGLLPDLPMLVVVAALKFSGAPPVIIFGLLYWQNWWQVTNAISHNFWLWGGLLLLAIIGRERLTVSARAIDRWSLVAVFAISGLLHVAIDFLVHRQDAHMSFWPVTRWKFISPVSYYDGAHYGHYFAAFEALFGLVLAVAVFRSVTNMWVRAALALAILAYGAVPAYFILH